MTVELSDVRKLADSTIPDEYVYAAYVVASGYDTHHSAGKYVPDGYQVTAFRLPRQGEKFLSPNGEVRTPFTGSDPGVYEPRLILEPIV